MYQKLLHAWSAPPWSEMAWVLSQIKWLFRRFDRKYSEWESVQSDLIPYRRTRLKKALHHLVAKPIFSPVIFLFDCWGLVPVILCWRLRPLDGTALTLWSLNRLINRTGWTRVDDLTNRNPLIVLSNWKSVIYEHSFLSTRFPFFVSKLCVWERKVYGLW